MESPQGSSSGDSIRVGISPCVLDVAYLASQVYFNPHPKELALRNDIFI